MQFIMYYRDIQDILVKLLFCKNAVCAESHAACQTIISLRQRSYLSRMFDWGKFMSKIKHRFYYIRWDDSE